MELFEQLRREYEFGIGTVKGVARKFGVHRRMVRQALASAIPPERTYKERAKPMLGPVTYLRDVLERVVNGYPASRLADLLPWNWKPAVNA